MPRTTYEISDQTRAVLTDKVTAIASEMDVNPSYLYQLLSGVGTDCFAKFCRLYAAAVRAGADTRYWDERLLEIRERNERRENLCIHQETARFAQESADVSIAHIEGKDAQTLLREAREAIAQGKRLERAALDEIEAQERTKRPHSDLRNKAVAVTRERIKEWDKNGRVPK